MGRPETITCARCDASVAVKPKGPVPSYCADCRRSGARTKPARPTSVTCERCGATVAVRDRGPLPRYCRDRCQTPTKEKTGPPTEASQAPATSATPLRPWDRAPARQPPAGRKPSSPSPRSTPLRRVAPITTRIDTIHPAVGTADLSRALRVGRLRHAAAVIGWITVVLLIALIVFVGSQPAPTGF